MLSGADISAYQGNINWQIFKNNVNFVIAKATEGIGFIDPWYGNNRQQAREANMLRGWYHFARPDLNPSGVDEANYFLNVCYDIQPDELLCLDYETQWNGDNVKWVKDFFDTISAKLNGYKAIFYSYQSMLTNHDWTPVTDHGLWVATASNDPNNVNFQTGAWSMAMMNQWGSQNIPGAIGQVDSNIFFGDTETFKKYGYKKPIITQPLPVPTIPPPPITQPPNVILELENKIKALNQSNLVLQNALLGIKGLVYGKTFWFYQKTFRKIQEFVLQSGV